MAFVATVLFLAFAYCAGYARMWQMDAEYRKLRDELKTLEAQREKVENKIGDLSSPVRLEEFALARGMVRDSAVPFVAASPSTIVAKGGVASIALTDPSVATGSP